MKDSNDIRLSEDSEFGKLHPAWVIAMTLGAAFGFWIIGYIWPPVPILRHRFLYVQIFFALAGAIAVGVLKMMVDLFFGNFFDE